MGDASFVQTSFLGGEWSPTFQGRTDHPKYRTGLNTCLNVIPLEEGAATRRPGFQFCTTTNEGLYARLFPYRATQTRPYNIELTNGILRLMQGANLTYNDDLIEVTAISTASPAVMTIASDQGWVTGARISLVYHNYTTAMGYPTTGQYVQRRTFKLTKLTGTTYSLYDDVTTLAVDGTKINYDHTHAPLDAISILRIPTAWGTTAIPDVKVIQDQERAVIMHTEVRTCELLVTPNEVDGAFLAEATLNPIYFEDGPYYDPIPSGNLQITTSASPSIVTLELNYDDYAATTSYSIGDYVTDSAVDYVSLTDNNLNNTPASSPTVWAVAASGGPVGPSGFQTTDVGRLIRILSEPYAWQVAAPYATGSVVEYLGGYYVQINTDTSTGDQPDISLTFWQPTTSTGVAVWTWGRIIVRNAADSVDIEVRGMPILWPSVLVRSWRLGLYSDTTGWPTCGTFHGGRMWLSGVVDNRFDASNSNDNYNFAPTGPDGTVADNNSISYKFNATDLNEIVWMEATGQGVIAGTKAGEWLIHASALNDPITPTNVQADRVTKYGCADVQPVNAGLALVFVQRYGRNVMEFLADVFSGKYSAPTINTHAKHLSRSGIIEMAYQQGITPTIWALKEDGTLAGVAYKRLSSFVTEEPSYSAWFRVTPGKAQTFVSICTNSREDGSIDGLFTVVHDTAASAYRIELMTPIPEDDVTFPNSWFLDDATFASGGYVTTESTKHGIRIYGLWHLEGQTVRVFMGGIKFGTYLVADGSCFVPDEDAAVTFNSTPPISTAYKSSSFVNSRVSVGSGGTTYEIVILAGLEYNSDAQILRPGQAVEAGSQNGPPFAKIRRGHQFGALILNAVRGAISFGTKYTALRPALFQSPGGTAYTSAQLYSGTYWSTLDDDYGFDTMLCWRATGPYPATICSLGGFLHTQDR